ncbi:MAG: tRNA epoxyqueuosine(34) reductase QueG [Rhodospirillales bacterium]
MSDGDAPDGDAPDGDAPDGGVPDGDVPNGGVPDGGEAIAAAIKRQALAVGFDTVAITDAVGTAEDAGHLAAYLADGRHGDMAWMERTADRRADPRVLWPEARSVLVCGLNYGPDGDPRRRQEAVDRGAISVYALGRDYHDVLRTRLKRLAGWIVATHGGEVKVFVDTAPVMEKPLAQRAGVGWIGKHTNLVSRRFGSWLFLGEVFTTLALPPDPPATDLCGSCDRCRQACPTGALDEPYRIEPRRCLSYLTIEHKGEIADDLAALFGNRVYGCDDCLAVCPWNRFASPGPHPELHARPDLDLMPLETLAGLGDGDFRRLFAGTAIKRSGRDRMARNSSIALANAGARDAGGTRRASAPKPPGDAGESSAGAGENEI